MKGNKNMDILQGIVLIIATIIITIEFILTLREIRKIYKYEQDKKKNNEIPKRIHTQITSAAFNTPIKSRYDKYKNKDGLYEPRKGKKGNKIEDFINKEI